LHFLLGLVDQVGRTPNSPRHLGLSRVEGHGAGGVRVVEPLVTTDEPEAVRGAPSTGVGRVLQERSERLGELGDVIERLDGRPVAVGAGHAAECMTASFGLFLEMEARVSPGVSPRAVDSSSCAPWTPRPQRP